MMRLHQTHRSAQTAARWTAGLQVGRWVLVGVAPLPNLPPAAVSWLADRGDLLQQQQRHSRRVWIPVEAQGLTVAGCWVDCGGPPFLPWGPAASLWVQRGEPRRRGKKRPGPWGCLLTWA